MYEKSRSKSLDIDLFEHPSCEYRGAPFWAWNTKLDEAELLRQIDCLHEMGMGGFFMHTRCGMSTEYLGKEFMRLIKSCADYAEKRGMYAYLYDEDRWPSGAAGGFVTENKRFRSKFITFSAEEMQTVIANGKREQTDPLYLVSFDVILDDSGRLVSYRKIDASAPANGRKWHVFRTLAKPGGWYNGYTYIDGLCPQATDRFIECTYEAYKKTVGEKFGKTVPAIFTDEPNISDGYRGPSFAADVRLFCYPWTDDFRRTFRKAHGYDILEKFPEVVWDLKDQPNSTRYDYYHHLCERFFSAFFQKIGTWCKDNGIAFTGHVLGEGALAYQSSTVCDAMRYYGSFGLPGIDMLCNSVELATAKQCQSAVHQYGKEGMTSELYGVTGWDFDFRGHKFQGDWQAALGVTLRVHHLSWVSMKGSAKRDYPASINYQSAWFKCYPLIEDHFARLNTVLTRGKPVVRVGVIHPIESMWLHMGPNDTSSAAQRRLEDRFSNLLKWFLEGNIDFDLIAESTLPELYKKTDEGFTVGEMTYSAVFIPPVDTLRSTTVTALGEFLNAGGKVVFGGKCPALADARPSDTLKDLYDAAKKTEFSFADLLNAFEEERDVNIVNDNGCKTDNLFYTLRADGEVQWLFIARCAMPRHFNGDEYRPQKIEITLKGCFTPEHYDTVSGSVGAISYTAEKGRTVIRYALEAHESLLLKLTPAEGERSFRLPDDARIAIKSVDFPEKVEFELGEPNVLVLDLCEYSWDKREWNPTEEMLRIDGKLRKQLHYPAADGQDVQPWKIPEEKPDKFPYLRFIFDSEIETDCRLAFEEATEITFNGKDVPVLPDGWFVDKAIKTVSLPSVRKGKNELVVRAPISKRISLENLFLLGNFGVAVNGRKAGIIALPDSVSFGSLLPQGLPFYGADIVYKLPFESPGGDIRIIADFFAGSVIRAELDGREVGKIAFAPYSLDVPDVAPGKHLLRLTLYASRINTFGALHDCTDRFWKGSNMWYTQDAEWSYEYVLKPVGILKSPEIKIFGK